MPDRVDQAIIEQLAKSDYPCPSCTYNLRGLTDLQCPECGRPLTHMDVPVATPRESDTQEIVRFLRDRDLKCKCGHNLRDNPTNQCPECDRTFQLQRGTPIAKRRVSIRQRLVRFCILVVALLLIFLVTELLERLS